MRIIYKLELLKVHVYFKTLWPVCFMSKRLPVAVEVVAPLLVRHFIEAKGSLLHPQKSDSNVQFSFGWLSEGVVVVCITPVVVGLTAMGVVDSRLAATKKLQTNVTLNNRWINVIPNFQHVLCVFGHVEFPIQNVQHRLKNLSQLNHKLSQCITTRGLIFILEMKASNVKIKFIFYYSSASLRHHNI